MTKPLIGRTIISAVFLFHAHAEAQTNDSAEAEAIRSTFAELVAASEAGDADVYATYLTDDALYLGPGAGPIEGKEAIRVFVAEFFANWIFSFPEWTTEEIVVSGDLAIHRYSGIAISTPKSGGNPIEADRKYLDVMRRQPDGQWLLSRHMYNLNQ